MKLSVPVSGATMRRVLFFIDASDDKIARWRSQSLGTSLPEIRGGINCWILQTYIRLREFNLPVELTNRIESDSVVVFHGESKYAVRRQLFDASRVVTVSVRADRPGDALATFEIVQNGQFADSKRRFSVPHWPQDGIVRRDERRGSGISRISYFGRAENLSPEYRSDGFVSELGSLGVDFHVDFGDAPAGASAICYSDYARTDAVLAVRPSCRKLHWNKPASKLVNSWSAGVPALLGPEYAYRELRRSKLDYFEVTSPSEALAAIGRLQADPALYDRMVENGNRRCIENDFEVVTKRWIELLEGFSAHPGGESSILHRGRNFLRRVTWEVLGR